MITQQVDGYRWRLTITICFLSALSRKQLKEPLLKTSAVVATGLPVVNPVVKSIVKPVVEPVKRPLVELAVGLGMEPVVE